MQHARNRNFQVGTLHNNNTNLNINHPGQLCHYADLLDKNQGKKIIIQGSVS